MGPRCNVRRLRDCVQSDVQGYIDVFVFKEGVDGNRRST